MESSLVQIPTGGPVLLGDLTLPAGTPGVVLFAHGSGSSRSSPRNRFVARTIQNAGIGTLLFDLLTAEEEAEDAQDGHLRFNIELLAGRLVDATRWIQETATRPLRCGYFGASTGGAAALVAAGALGDAVRAVVSRGGRPDLAGPSLAHVTAPTLLIVGERDEVVVKLNRIAYDQLRSRKQLTLVPGATHLFEEPGALETVASLASAWFQQYLVGESFRATTGQGRKGKDS